VSRPATQREILSLLAEGWALRRAGYSGDWWLTKDGTVRKAHIASARALLGRGEIKEIATDFYRGDTYALTQAGTAAITSAKEKVS